jgi:hypothetical protein
MQQTNPPIILKSDDHLISHFEGLSLKTGKNLSIEKEFIDLLTCLTSLKEKTVGSFADLKAKIEAQKNSQEFLERRALVEEIANRLIFRQFPKPAFEALRELLSNCIDAHVRIDHVGADYCIVVTLNDVDHQISFKDQGDGMDWSKMIPFFVPGRSSNPKALFKAEDGLPGVSGQFGQGSFAAYFFLLHHISSLFNSLPTIQPKEKENGFTFSLLVIKEDKPHEITFDSENLEIVVRPLEKKEYRKVMKIHSLRENGDPIFIVFREKLGKIFVKISEKEKKEEGTITKISSPLINSLFSSRAVQFLNETFRYASQVPFQMICNSDVSIQNQTLSSPSQCFNSLTHLDKQTDASTQKPSTPSSSSSQYFYPVMDPTKQYESMPFDGGTLWFPKNIKVTESLTRQVTISEKGRRVIFFPASAEIGIDFEKLHLSQERSSLNFEDEELKHKIMGIITQVWNHPDWSWEVRAALLNSFYPLIVGDKFNLIVEIKTLIQKTASVPFLPALEKLRKLHLKEAIYLNPAYLDQITLPVVVEMRGRRIFVVEPGENIEDRPFTFLYFKHGGYRNLLINKSLLQKDQPALSQFNLYLIDLLLKFEAGNEEAHQINLLGLVDTACPLPLANSHEISSKIAEHHPDHYEYLTDAQTLFHVMDLGLLVITDPDFACLEQYDGKPKDRFSHFFSSMHSIPQSCLAKKYAYYLRDLLLLQYQQDNKNKTRICLEDDNWIKFYVKIFSSPHLNLPMAHLIIENTLKMVENAPNSERVDRSMQSLRYDKDGIFQEIQEVKYSTPYFLQFVAFSDIIQTQMAITPFCFDRIIEEYQKLLAIIHYADISNQEIIETFFKSPLKGDLNLCKKLLDKLSLKARQEYLSLLPYFHDIPYLLNLPNKQLINLVAAVHSYHQNFGYLKGRVSENTKAVTLTSTDCDLIIKHIINNEKISMKKKKLWVSLYLMILDSELAARFQLHKESLFKLLLAIRPKKDGEDLKALGETLRNIDRFYRDLNAFIQNPKDFGYGKAAALPGRPEEFILKLPFGHSSIEEAGSWLKENMTHIQKLKADPSAQNRKEYRSFIIESLENKELIKEDALPYILVALLGETLEISNGDYDFHSFDEKSLFSLHKHPIVAKKIGNSSLARIRIQGAMRQSINPYFWVNEILKNGIEADAKNILFKIYSHAKKESESEKISESDRNSNAKQFLVITVQDDGSGMAEDSLIALITPGISTKRKMANEDPNYGWGFYGLLAYCEEVHIETIKDGQFSRYILRKEGNEVLIFVDETREEKESQDGTLFIFKKEVKNPLIESIQLKSQLMASCKYLTQVNVSLNDKLLPKAASVSPVASYEEPYLNFGSVRVELGSWDEGIYFKNMKMGRLFPECFDLVPQSLMDIMDKDKIKFAIFLPKAEQVMNRSHFIHQEDMLFLIQKCVLMSSIEYLHNQWLEGCHLDMLPIKWRCCLQLNLLKDPSKIKGIDHTIRQMNPQAFFIEEQEQPKRELLARTEKFLQQHPEMTPYHPKYKDNIQEFLQLIEHQEVLRKDTETFKTFRELCEDKSQAFYLYTHLPLFPEEPESPSLHEIYEALSKRLHERKFLVDSRLNLNRIFHKTLEKNCWHLEQIIEDVRGQFEDYDIDPILTHFEEKFRPKLNLHLAFDLRKKPKEIEFTISFLDAICSQIIKQKIVIRAEFLDRSRSSISVDKKNQNLIINLANPLTESFFNFYKEFLDTHANSVLDKDLEESAQIVSAHLMQQGPVIVKWLEAFLRAIIVLNEKDLELRHQKLVNEKLKQFIPQFLSVKGSLNSNILEILTNLILNDLHVKDEDKKNETMQT